MVIKQLTQCLEPPAGSIAKRRGPMDEMRQLQRILTKLLPASASYMPAGTDGGGNKVLFLAPSDQQLLLSKF
jgi:hypothetical protein